MAYSERDKIFYVEKMWSEGLTPGEAARLWGRPSRSTLARWQADADAGLLDARRPAVPHACAGHVKHARWPEETRAEALRLHGEGRAPRQIAAMLGLDSGDTVRGWIEQERLRARRGPAGGAAAPSPAGAARVAELERELEEARLEASVLRAILDDPKAGGLASLSARRRTELGERLRRGYGFSLRRVLGLLGLSKSTYEYNRRALLDGREARGRAARDGLDALDALVGAAFGASGGEYGYRRVCAALMAAGTPRSEREVRDSMRRQGLVARCGRTAGRRWSLYAGENGWAPPNLMLGPRGRHDFSAAAPGERLVTDITEMRAAGGAKVYASAVVDLYDQRLLSCRTSRRPDSALADSSLGEALARLPEGARPVVHSDRGVHYRAGSWIAACERAGVVRSMSRKGRSPDNAPAEGFFGQLKCGMYHGAGELLGPDGLEAEVARWAAWYNSGRLKSFGGDRRPCAYETIDGRRARLGVWIE